MVSTRPILAVLAILMVVVMLGANVAVALDRGPLDEAYVADHLEDEGAYTVLHSSVLVELEGEMPEPPDDLPGNLDLSGIVADTVTEAYLQSQLEGAIVDVYAYLHGETDTLTVEVDLQPLIDNFEAAVASQIAALSLGEIGISELTFTVEGETVEVNPAALDIDRAHYEDELGTFEADVKEIIRENYEEETGEEPSDEQVEQMYADLQDDLRADLVSTVGDSIAGLGLPAAVEAAAADMSETIADAYTTEMTYDEFDAQLEADKAALGSAAASYAAEEQGDDLPRSYQLEGVGDDELEPAVQVVSVIGTLAWLLPLLALGLVGGMYAATRDVVPTAKAAGVVFVVVGALSAGITLVVPGVIEDQLLAGLDADAVGAGIADLVPIVLGVVFDPLATQSFILVVLGLGLVGGGFVYERHRAGEPLVPDVGGE